MVDLWDETQSGLLIIESNALAIPPLPRDDARDVRSRITPAVRGVIVVGPPASIVRSHVGFDGERRRYHGR